MQYRCAFYPGNASWLEHRALLHLLGNVFQWRGARAAGGNGASGSRSLLTGAPGSVLGGPRSGRP